MKVAVLGSGPEALVACDAIHTHGHTPIMIVLSDEEGKGLWAVSPLNELNFGYPGVDPIDVEFSIFGATEDFVPHWKAQHPELDRAGIHAYAGNKPMATDSEICRKIINTMPETRLLTWQVDAITLSDLLDIEGGADVIINTVDRNRFCGVEEHTFIRTAMWWSHLKGPQGGSNTVLYNVGTSPAWAMHSKIKDTRVTIWDQEPPFDDIYLYTMPTKTTCTCETPYIGLHVGREATYSPIGLAHCYEQVVEFLYHPLAKINEETDGEPPSDT